MLSVLIANVAHDCYRHLWQHPERHQEMKTSVGGIWWIVAIVESAFIRMFSEFGRVRGMISRGEFSHLGRRFDWFAGRAGDGPRKEESFNNIQRVILSLLIFCILFRL
ncbi:hypothetical protein ABKN59_011736 [Abortiporus biennis]